MARRFMRFEEHPDGRMDVHQLLRNEGVSLDDLVASGDDFFRLYPRDAQVLAFIETAEVGDVIETGGACCDTGYCVRLKDKED